MKTHRNLPRLTPLALLLVCFLLLVACQTASPTPATQPVSPPAAEETTAVESYPSPETEAVQASLTSLYPDPVSGDTVIWGQAVGFILNGEVVKVVQTHDRQVTLELRDGRTLLTEEPAIDEVTKLIQGCGDRCKNIIIVTE